MRFAVLHHDHPFSHWDLLLETAAGCWTWRLLNPPESAASIRAERIADHRSFYLDYSGPVSGDRGTVTQVDAGTLVWIRATESDVIGLVHGRRWHGRITLSAESADVWRMQYEPREKSAP